MAMPSCFYVSTVYASEPMSTYSLLHYYFNMSQAIASNVSTNSNDKTAQAVSKKRLTPKQRQQRYIFALMLHDGRLIVGSATNAAKRIAAINGGMNSAVPKALQVNRILGVKPVTEERTLPSVVASYCERFGENRVICV
jgi:hypothetical protein